MAAGVASQHVAEAEQAGGRLAHRLARHLSIGIGAVAAGEQTLLAEPALAAADREGDNDPVADLEVGDLRAELDHLAHILVTEYVAALHGRLIAVEEMQVGAADRAGGDFDDRVARMLDFGIGHGVNANIAFAVPAKCAHCVSLSRLACSKRTCGARIMFPLRAARMRAIRFMLRWRHCDQLAAARLAHTVRRSGCRFQWWDVTTAPAVISFMSAGPEITMSVPNVLSTYFGNERKLAAHVIGTMKRRETTANEHWTVKAIFAFALTCLVGAEIALYSGLAVLPSNWP